MWIFGYNSDYEYLRFRVFVVELESDSEGSYVLFYLICSDMFFRIDRDYSS